MVPADEILPNINPLLHPPKTIVLIVSRMSVDSAERIQSTSAAQFELQFVVPSLVTDL